MFNKIGRMLARLPTYWTYVKERPSWLLVLFGGRILSIRRYERRLRRAPIGRIGDGLLSRLLVKDPKRIVDDLNLKGVATGFALAAADVIAIQEFVAQTQCSTRVKPVVRFHHHEIEAVNATRSRDVIAAYYFDQVRDCATISDIETDPLIRAWAAAYIGAEPHHIRTRLWWSFPGKRVIDADLHAAAQGKFHFDLNDFRTIKFFFYITDVDLGSGPHVCITGSHLKRKLKHQFTFMVGHNESELREYYDADAFKTLIGPAGTGFAEDPFIFHVGMTCKDRARLLLEIEFGPAPASKSYRYGLRG